MKNIFGIDFNKLDLNDLWKNEKQHFRIWFILFIVFWSIITLLYLGLFVLDLVFKDEIIKSIDANIKNGPEQKNDSNPYYNTRLVIDILFFIGPAIILILFVISLVDSYKKKTFIGISSFSITLAKFIGIMTIINLILFSTSYIYANGETIYSKIYSSLSGIVILFNIIQLFFAANNISKIKKLFIQKELENQAKIFFDAMNKAQNNSPFGPDLNSFFNNAQTKQQSVNEEEATVVNDSTPKTDSEKQMIIKKILELPNEQLHKIAEKLNIFGYEEMSKEQLAEIIYNHTKK
ncbi:hypothetical protein RRG51_00770 [Mycoplasmopsis cynos]|uniref:hypothetical protein n=1 Tax=Mycoplasmopsis cynos TaxID=171284 RepID=UPI002AFDE3EF|nr:hypothetical protein [Mycoplasmopsis cynos]WQQ16285.1 hypothetical protein RRG51_00770 [Mycoplasmopsis cynos]